MNSILDTYKLHKFFFGLLLLVTILDPGNDIFKLKEVFFVLTVLIGLVNCARFISLNVLVGSIFFSLVFPILWTFLGYLFNYNFSPEYAVMYLKSIAFFLLINVSLDERIDFSKQFAISTMVLIPITIFIFFIVDEFQVADVFFLKFEKTFLISKRAFGGFVFNPVVFYKTSPLLIFGLSYVCQKNRFKYSIINFMAIIACIVTMIISGTRANMAGSFIIVIYFFYRNYVSISKIRKSVFWSFFAVISFLFLVPFLSQYVFDVNEQSNETKLSIINDYFSLWSNNFLSIFFGQGLGGGFDTVDRGISYLAEPTYFEIIRMFGLIGGIIFFFFLIMPLFLFLNSKSSSLFERNYYMLVAYIIYILIEFPSNPLLLSSTGMVVMVVIYSVSIKVFSFKHQQININI